MSDELTAVVDPASARRVENNIRRLTADLHKSLPDALKQTAWYIGKAASGATKMAPQRRRVIQNPEYKTSYIPGFWKGSAGKQWAVKQLSQRHPPRILPINAKTKAQAEHSKKAIIRRRGLARDAWIWILRDVGAGPRGSTHNRPLPRAFSTLSRLSGTDPFIKMVDRIQYATKAFKTRGTSTISNVGQRAMNLMEQMIERRLANRLRRQA